jgi:hypothetical protein
MILAACSSAIGRQYVNYEVDNQRERVLASVAAMDCAAK